MRRRPRAGLGTHASVHWPIQLPAQGTGLRCTDYHELLPDVWQLKPPEALREYRAEERRDKA
jgi:hypothetical protein